MQYGAGDFNPREVLFLCAACGFDFYHNPIPSAVVLATQPQRPEAVLVIRRSTPPGVGLWCLPGGFIRYGEPPEAAAARELREEAHVEGEIGRVIRVGLLDYAYRGRRLCILEVAFEARLTGSLPTAAGTSAEALEIAFMPKAALLQAPGSWAFPEQLEVLRAPSAAAALLR